ncbi:paralemmin-1-like [Antennarius striatus]|uniref:paralemmin-1-like n=1 Tax=Antennarius striatus TaxID=241820 RepID=UPI0035B09574
MDLAEKYQERLHVIEERHRQQEEERKLRRETTEEWLTTAQKKRRFLREQWLSGTSSPNISTPRHDDDTDTPAVQKTSEEEKAAVTREKERVNEGSVCSAAARAPDIHQAGSDEAVQVSKDAEDNFTTPMEQRIFAEERNDGRSVLGTLAVQVERDPRTGATVVRSVTPVSPPAGAPVAVPLFDDGRKSIHAVSGEGVEPSTEELGQILSVIDGVGMKVLLDEVTVTPFKGEAKIKNEDVNTVPERQVMSDPTRHREEDTALKETSKGSELEAQLKVKDSAETTGTVKENEDKRIMVDQNIAEEISDMEVQNLDERPVTLLFLGYTDSTPVQDQDQENYEGMLTAERVIISDEGEEEVVASASPQVREASQEHPEVFQDVPLEGNGAAGVKIQGEEGDKKLRDPSLLTTAEGGTTSKSKTCQCCSIM